MIEVGAIAYSPRLKQTCAGTEAMYLLMRLVFDDLRSLSVGTSGSATA